MLCADQVSTGAGADRVSAGAGADRVSTGGGADRINPGSGRDLGFNLVVDGELSQRAKFEHMADELRLEKGMAIRCPARSFQFR